MWVTGVQTCALPILLFTLKNPSFYAARPPDLELAVPPLPPVRARSSGRFRRPRLLSFVLPALFLLCAPPVHRALFSCSPDRRRRARPNGAAATRNSDEQSRKEETTTEHVTSPPGPPRHADHAGKIRVSGNAAERREQTVPSRRRRPPPLTVTVAAGP